MFWRQVRGTVASIISSLFWDVTQRRLVVTDVSGKRIGPVLEGQAFQLEFLKDGLLHT